MLSVVIPALNASHSLRETLTSVAAADEAVVADGGSSDETGRLAASLGARVVQARRGRGSQLAAGVAAAQGDWLLLLHADTRLAVGWQTTIGAHMVASPGHAGYCRFRLDSDDRRARRLERLVAWRCRVFALPYGDQGLLIHRDLLRATGGIRPLPLMEDVDLIRRLGRRRLCTPGRCRDHLGREMAAPRMVPAFAAQPALPDAVFRRRPATADRPDLRMKGIVVVFARAPRLGAVKRRLGREIGARAALRFHLATLTRLTRALAADRRYRTVLAITPDRARLRLPVRVAWMPQGSGHVGSRMHRAFRRFPRSRVALIGSDIPDAGPADVWAAFRALGSAQAAFGPAEDGGYWLVAHVAPTPGTAVRRGSLVERTCAGRHPGKFCRSAGRHAAHAARRGHGGRSA